jgi:hypothetical protein
VRRARPFPLTELLAVVREARAAEVRGEAARDAVPRDEEVRDEVARGEVERGERAADLADGRVAELDVLGGTVPPIS